MTDAHRDVPRDDRAWPRAALPVSVIAVLLSLSAGVFITARRQWELAAVAQLLAGFVVGCGSVVITVRRWLRGEAIPASLSVVAGGLAVVAIVAGAPAILGLFGGMMFGNVLAILWARANRQHPARSQ